MNEFTNMDITAIHDILEKSETECSYQGLHESMAVVNVTGDWKHDHGHIDWLMEKSGYKQVKKEIIGDNSSDWYKAKHYYVKL